MPTASGAEFPARHAGPEGAGVDGSGVGDGKGSLVWVVPVTFPLRLHQMKGDAERDPSNRQSEGGDTKGQPCGHA